MRMIVVRAHWDPESEVWVAMSDDVPGLVTEAETQRELVEKLHVMIPELLEDGNGNDYDAGETPEIPVVIMSEQCEIIRLRGPRTA